MELITTKKERQAEGKKKRKKEAKFQNVVW